MPPPLERQIREQLARYIAGEQSLETFAEWFFPATWNVHLRDDRAAADFAYEIGLRLAEFSNGDWTEDELKALLRPLVEPRPVSAAQPE